MPQDRTLLHMPQLATSLLCEPMLRHCTPQTYRWWRQMNVEAFVDDLRRSELLLSPLMTSLLRLICTTQRSSPSVDRLLHGTTIVVVPHANVSVVIVDCCHLTRSLSGV
jgi:hypothetical protein